MDPCQHTEPLAAPVANRMLARGLPKVPMSKYLHVNGEIDESDTAILLRQLPSYFAEQLIRIRPIQVPNGTKKVDGRRGFAKPFVNQGLQHPIARLRTETH